MSRPKRTPAGNAALDDALRLQIRAALAGSEPTTANVVLFRLGKRDEKRVYRLLADLVADGTVVLRVGPYRWQNCLGKPGFCSAVRLYSLTVTSHRKDSHRARLDPEAG